MKCKVGDIIKIIFFHYHESEKREVIGRVLEIKTRLGKQNRGRDYIAPLIKYKNLNTGEEKSCDMGWVVEILKSSKEIPRKENIFKNPQLRWIKKSKKGVWESFLPDLIALSLKDINNTILTHINVYMANLLYIKDRKPGCVRDGEFSLIYRVNKKPFKKWVSKNYEKFMVSKKEQSRHITEINMTYEKEYWESIEEENEKWANEYDTDTF